MRTMVLKDGRRVTVARDGSRVVLDAQQTVGGTYYRWELPYGEAFNIALLLAEASESIRRDWPEETKPKRSTKRSNRRKS